MRHLIGIATTATITNRDIKVAVRPKGHVTRIVIGVAFLQRKDRLGAGWISQVGVLTSGAITGNGDLLRFVDIVDVKGRGIIGGKD